VPHRLTQLLADNRGLAGRRFEARPIAAADGAATDEAEVFLYDAIVDSEIDAEYWGGVAPQGFIKALRDIKASTIHLRINSPGGSVFAARTIETALREHKAKIVVHIDGLAASAATFIAMAGDEIVMSPGAMFMIHKAWTIAWGNADDLTATADLLTKLDGTLADTYAARTKGDKQQIADWMAAETWFTAQEALEARFIDRIVEDAPAADAAAASTAAPGWNLSAFLARVARPAAKDQSQTQPDPARIRQQQRLRVAQLATPIA
jgi:ATP-dependent Clp protease protease subunit